MINLLPDSNKKDIQAARVNVILVRYIGIIAIAIVFLLSALYVSYMLLQQTKESAQAQISANDLKADIYSDTRAEVEKLSQGLSQAKTALNQETRYSKILTSLGSLMPQGTIIESLDVNSTSIGAPITITVLAKSSNEIIALQNQFRTSQLITNPTFQTVNETGGSIQGYPASVTLSFSLNKAGAL